MIENKRIDIRTLPFRGLTRNAFEIMGVNFLDELCIYTHTELLRKKFIGRKALQEIRSILSNYGLSLANDKKYENVKFDEISLDEILKSLKKTLNLCKKEIDNSLNRIEKLELKHTY